LAVAFFSEDGLFLSEGLASDDDVVVSDEEDDEDEELSLEADELDEPELSDFSAVVAVDDAEDLPLPERLSFL
jgi:hypothetical protein